MKEMVLLGAGASVEAGIPDTFDMTRRMMALFAEDHGLRTPNQVIHFAVGGLLFQRGIRGEDPFEGVNVEELFNAVQLLAERESLEAAPFIGSWHPLVQTLDQLAPARADLDKIQREILNSVTKAISDAGKDSLSSSAGNDIDRFMDELVNGRKPSRKLGRLVSDLIKTAFEKLRPGSSSGNSALKSELSKAVEQKERPGRGAIFRRTTSLMIQALAKMVWIEDQHRVAYLQPLVRTSGDEPRVIATLNYDNGIELSASACGVAVSTGIDVWSREQRFPQAESGVSLIKLHGSIDWAIKEGKRSVDRPIPFATIERLDSSAVREKHFHPAVIFGGRNKLTAAGPFLDLLRWFQQELKRVDRLTVVGYSFRDDHVNEFIGEWLNGDPSRVIRVINGPGFRRTSITFAQHLLELEPSGPAK